MKKTLTVLMMILFSLTMSAQGVKAQSSFTKTGNAYTQKLDNPNHYLTQFTWEDKKGNIYPIWVNLKTGASFVKKKSQKSGKEYNSKLPEDVCIDVARRLGLNYVPKNG